MWPLVTTYSKYFKTVSTVINQTYVTVLLSIYVQRLALDIRISTCLQAVICFVTIRNQDEW